MQLQNRFCYVENLSQRINFSALNASLKNVCMYIYSAHINKSQCV